MLVYSRKHLLSLCYWWKDAALHGLQISRLNSNSNSLCYQPVTPLAWNTLKELNILRPFRGKRSGLKARNISPSIDENSSREITSNVKSFNIQTQNLNNYSSIKSIVTHRQSLSCSKGVGVNTNNLIPIKVVSKHDDVLLQSKLGLWNARSINAKAAVISEYILSEKLSILAITETWLRGDHRDNVTLSTINNCLPNYTISHIARSGRGGGVCVIYNKGYNVIVSPPHTFTTFEYLDMVISSGPVSFRLVNIYKPPLKAGRTHTFLDEFSTLLEELVIYPGRLIIVGDFNFHIELTNNRDAASFSELLVQFGLQQLVDVPTHTRGHTLDLIIVRQSDVFVSGVVSSFDLPSDHAIITCSISVPRPRPTRIRVSHRKLRDIDITSLSDDITKLSLITAPDSCLDGLIDQYNTGLKLLLDKHAPVKARMMTLRPHAPWYTDTLRVEKREKRRRERKWRSTGLEVDKQLFKEQCDKYQKMLNQSKANYHKSKLDKCNSRELFAEVDKLVNGKHDYALPFTACGNDLAQSFLDFFNDKINLLLAPVSRPNVTSTYHHLDTPVACCLSKFPSVSIDTVKSIILKSPSKSCDLDPIPTCLLKSCLDTLASSITSIINLSLSTGKVPSALKVARVIPCLKKKSLDKEQLCNYRPISNLPFLSKTNERVVAMVLNDYLQENKLLSPLQSAYRRHHSVETALLRVTNDLLLALDSGMEILLVLLDYSAAFDTVNHDLLLDRLKIRYGLQGTVLSWISSYLEQRTHYVSVANANSNTSIVQRGVPQGSVLGPLFFSLYVSPIEDLIKSHGLEAMFYADDTQIYVIMNTGNRSTSIETLEACAKDIKSWSIYNDLVLNDSKTEVVHIFSSFARHHPDHLSITIGDASLGVKRNAMNLGVLFDKHLNLKSHISNICNSSFVALRNISKIRRYLDITTTERLVHAFITSRLDTCNSLLYGLPSKELDRLQRIQNSAARLVTLTRRGDHITPILKELHWLTIPNRIAFKVLLITYKALHGLAPEYLINLLKPYKQTRNLRSNNKLLLAIPSTKTITFGERAFSRCAPKLWNDLPFEIKRSESLDIFKKRLKTFLFNK